MWWRSGSTHRPTTVGDDHDNADIPKLVGDARNTRPRNAKQWLNNELVADMTPDLLREVDPNGDVRGWLQAIGRILEG